MLDSGVRFGRTSDRIAPLALAKKIVMLHAKLLTEKKMQDQSIRHERPRPLLTAIFLLQSRPERTVSLLLDSGVSSPIPLAKPPLAGYRTA